MYPKCYNIIELLDSVEAGRKHPVIWSTATGILSGNRASVDEGVSQKNLAPLSLRTEGLQIGQRWRPHRRMHFRRQGLHAAGQVYAGAEAPQSHPI